MPQQQYDVLIVGGGAAGLSAALTLGRACRRVAVVDADRPRNRAAKHMHGFPSRDGMSPRDFLALTAEEAQSYGAVITKGFVTRAVAHTEGFTVWDGNGGVLHGRKLLVTTGLTDELPAIPGLAERWGRDVLHCPYCHGHELRDQPLAVLRAHSTSVEHALLIRQWSRDLTFLRPSTMPVSTAAERARLTRLGVHVVDPPVAGLVIADDRLTGIRLADGTVVTCTALFVAPRLVANDSILSSLGARTESWEMGTYIVADSEGRTTVPGVRVAGNISDPRANVLGAAAAGSLTAAAINRELVSDDVSAEQPFSAEQERVVSNVVQGVRRHGL